MKSSKVLDSWALLAYFEGQKEGLRVTGILKEAAQKGRDLLISVINWGEVLYIIQSRYGKEKKDEIEHLMSQMHLKIIDVNTDLTRIAASFKAVKKLPYADCFAAALAKQEKISLLTGDRDFLVIENDVTIDWL
ncbi:MAG: type II toxin-antitoxin system VapC family toxin [Chlamydiae bacterium]|nr:type II toxin-antitoxin system VapC family toxin [Chlamydiota bacterium]MBI3277719.1 type II toxin-antitoxin system VapC family toxin [Chlamydiota bacterium]